MTPRVNQSGRVLLDIEQEVSSVARTTSSGIDSPTFRQRRVHTSVAVANNETLVLGGLIQDQRTQGRTQIPILGDIPLIGNAFRRKEDGIGKTELIIMITPHVMRSVNEARHVSDEFRREMALSPPPSVRQLRNAWTKRSPNAGLKVPGCRRSDTAPMACAAISAKEASRRPRRRPPSDALWAQGLTPFDLRTGGYVRHAVVAARNVRRTRFAPCRPRRLSPVSSPR